MQNTESALNILHFTFCIEHFLYSMSSVTDPHPEQPAEELVAYLDGELPPEECRHIEARLAADADYRQQLRDLDQAWEALDALPTRKANDDFARTTMELVTVAAQADASAVTATATALGCGAPLAQFPTLDRPASPPRRFEAPPVQTLPPTLLARAQHLRADAVHALLLALSLGDEQAVAGFLHDDGQLALPQQALPLTAHALLNELETRSRAQSAGPPEAGLVLTGRVVGVEGDAGLIVEVEGSPTVRGTWTVVFSDSPVNRIKEVRLPPPAT